MKKQHNTCIGESFILPQSLQQPTAPPPLDEGAEKKKKLINLKCLVWIHPQVTNIFETNQKW